METAVIESWMPVIFDGKEHAGADLVVLVDVWREACRHIEIQELTHTIGGILAKHAPLAQLLVRRIDRQKLCLETVAVGIPVPDYLTPEARSAFDEAHFACLLGWCRRRQSLHRGGEARDQELLRMIIPPGIAADVVAVPLGQPENPSGVVVLVAKTRATFDHAHICLAESLMEPFSVALENDHRLREMTAIRVAAEADRDSLLKRLGRKQLTDIVVGADSGLSQVVERVALVARNDAPVLLLGETGTGKEVIARMVHNQSPRGNGPFMRVNCGAIPAELIDSQLFGHERGAFTGAVETRQGWFERADGGTLLLDEVGELPLAAQVRLLRILQDGWMERVGDA